MNDSRIVRAIDMTGEACEAWAVKDDREELIEGYASVAEAFVDMLQMWPEDDWDTEIRDTKGDVVIRMVRGFQPEVCRVFMLGRYVESVQCWYEEGEDGEVVTRMVPIH